MEVQSPFKLNDKHLRPADFYDTVINSTKRYGNQLALADASTGWSCNYDEIEGYVATFYEYFNRSGITADNRPALIAFNCPEIYFTQLAAAFIGCDLIHASPLATVVTDVILWTFSSAPWNPPDTSSRKQERSLLALPLIHNYASTASFFVLCKGDALITIPRFAPEAFLLALEKYRINYVHVVPPLVSFLANDDSVGKYDLSHLHSVSSGAAPLPPNVAAKCKERLRLKDMRQIYGMTEVRISTWVPYGHTNFASIGVPMPGVRIKFVDPDTKTTISKPYEHGAMWLTGPQTGGCYFENQQANRDTFIVEDGVTWCKTGDVGYFDELGYLYLTDRDKDLIKYKGTQISPSEIEAILRQHPSVADCAVIGRPDEQAGEVPVAFVVKRNSGSPVTAETLRNLVKGRLSSYKQLTGGVVFLDELPRSNTGKILKRRLRELLSEHGARGSKL